jgi:hypothetical protein
MKLITTILITLFVITLASPVSASSEPARPVPPHSPAATVQRAFAIMAARMAQPRYTEGTLFVTEVTGGDYTVLVRALGVSGYEAQGAVVSRQLLTPGGWILVTVAAIDDAPVSCRIWAQDGQVVSESIGGWAAQCRVDG